MAENVLIRGGERALSTQIAYNVADSYRNPYNRQFDQHANINHVHEKFVRQSVSNAAWNTIINVTLSPNVFISQLCL